MKLPFGFELKITKDFPIGFDRPEAWFPVVREPYAGAWQKNDFLPIESVLSNTTVYRCITLIASDIAKMELDLLSENADGIGEEIETSAFSPVLEHPNHFQNSIQFFEQWMISKLTCGNTFVLKGRDGRNVVNELYVLNPHRVRPMVAPNGDVFYELKRDDLYGVHAENVTVPATQVIHDRMNPIYHPLWGLSPLYAGRLPASQALKIIRYSDQFFGNAARPSGVLSAPGLITQDTANRLKSHWESNYTAENAGKVAVLGDGLKFEPMTQNAVDAELVPQLRLSDEKVCTAYGVPAFKIGVQAPPPYDNIEALDQTYYSGCLQSHIESIERLMTAGLELPSGYSVEFDLDGLLRMDTTRMVDAHAKMVGNAIETHNEAREKFGLPPLPGGEFLMAQQQMFTLEALANRANAPPLPAAPAPALAPVPPDTAKEFSRALIVIRGGLANV